MSLRLQGNLLPAEGLICVALSNRRALQLICLLGTMAVRTACLVWGLPMSFLFFSLKSQRASIKISCIALLRNLSSVSDVLFPVLYFRITPLMTSQPVLLFYFKDLSQMSMLLVEYSRLLKIMYVRTLNDLLFEKSQNSTLSLFKILANTSRSSLCGYCLIARKQGSIELKGELVECYVKESFI